MQDYKWSAEQRMESDEQWVLRRVAVNMNTVFHY